MKSNADHLLHIILQPESPYVDGTIECLVADRTWAERPCRMVGEDDEPIDGCRARDWVVALGFSEFVECNVHGPAVRVVGPVPLRVEWNEDDGPALTTDCKEAT